MNLHEFTRLTDRQRIPRMPRDPIGSNKTPFQIEGGDLEQSVTEIIMTCSPLTIDH